MKNKYAKNKINLSVDCSDADLYYNTLPCGNIEIVEDYRVFLTYLFAQAGINVNNINTLEEFEKSRELSNSYSEKALLWWTEKSNNKFYIKAFKALLSRDNETFLKEIEKGQRYSYMRKNLIHN